MRILHVTAWHSSFKHGGTEAYIDGLAQGLLDVANIPSHCLVINATLPDGERDGVTYLYPAGKNLDVFREKVVALLKRLQPQAVFLHTVASYEPEVAIVARELNLPTVAFFHALNWVCYQQYLQFCGKESCEVLFKPERCAACMTSGHSGSYRKGRILSICYEKLRRLHFMKGGWLETCRRELPMKAQAYQQATFCVAFTEQDKRLLAKNGVKEERLAVIPQGLSKKTIEQCQRNAQCERSGCLKLGYVGRVAEIKGVHLLVQALHSLPHDMDLQLDIYGCGCDKAYDSKLLEFVDGDPRIHFHSMLPPEEVLKAYGQFDVLCIPSIVFETGPLTLLEGVYSGCKVYGTTAIGQRGFLVKHGTLLKDNTIESWKDAFQDCLNDLSEIRNVRRTDFSYRTMETIAGEILNKLQVIC